MVHRRSAIRGSCWQRCGGGGTPGRILPGGNEPSQRPTWPSSALQAAHRPFRLSFQLQLQSRRRRRRRRFPRSGRSARGPRSSSACKYSRPQVREHRSPRSSVGCAIQIVVPVVVQLIVPPSCLFRSSTLPTSDSESMDDRQTHPVLARNVTPSMRWLLLDNQTPMGRQSSKAFWLMRHCAVATACAVMLSSSS